MVLMDSVPYKQSKLWDNYFLIIETLDEKQVHIVKQVIDLPVNAIKWQL